MSNNKSSKLIFMKRAQIAAGLTAILVLSGCGSSSAMNELNLSYEGAKLQFMGDAVQCAKDAQGGLSAVVDQSSTNQADPSVVNLTLIDQGGKPMVNIYANSNKTIVASAAMETTKAKPYSPETTKTKRLMLKAHSAASHSWKPAQHLVNR